MIEYAYESPFGAWRIRSIEPPPDLARYVDKLWETTGSVSYGYEKLLPSGFADFMINLGPPQTVLDRPDGGSAATYREAWLSGIHSRPLFAAPAGTTGMFRTHFVGASLRPQGVTGIFGIDAVDVANRVLDAGDVVGPSLVSLRDRIGESASTAESLDILAGFLRLASEKASRPVSSAAVWAMDRTLARSGDVRIGQLCKELGVSRKHLNALYRSAAGLSPKVYARLIRFQSLIDNIQNPENSWVHVAATRGYFDQSHLIRDFREFAGETPASLVDSCSPDGKGVNYADPPDAE